MTKYCVKKSIKQNLFRVFIQMKKTIIKINGIQFKDQNNIHYQYTYNDIENQKYRAKTATLVK